MKEVKMAKIKGAFRFSLIFAVGLLLGLVSRVNAQDEMKSKHEEKRTHKEQHLSKKDLPAAVMTAFQKQYPTASIKEVGKEDADNTTFYEIESIDGKSKRTVLYSADGNLAEIEEVISAKQLPDTARAVIARDYPKGDLEGAEKVTKGGITSYEVKIENGKKNIEAVFDSAGILINTEKVTDTEDND